MGRVNRYEFQGEVIQVPVAWDEVLGREAEDYGGYYAGPVYTPAGRPVLLTIEDACPEAEMVDDTRPASTAAPAAIIINFPVLCWAYVITRNGGRNGAPAGAARAPKPRRK